MCDKAVDSYPHTLKFFLDCYITQKLWDIAANTHPSTMKFVSDCYKTQEICDKTVNSIFLHLFIFLINIKFQKCAMKLFMKILLC